MEPSSNGGEGRYWLHNRSGDVRPITTVCQRLADLWTIRAPEPTSEEAGGSTALFEYSPARCTGHGDEVRAEDREGFGVPIVPVLRVTGLPPSRESTRFSS